jgi:hypothetical protein
MKKWTVFRGRRLKWAEVMADAEFVKIVHAKMPVDLGIELGKEATATWRDADSLECKR